MRDARVRDGEDDAATLRAALAALEDCDFDTLFGLAESVEAAALPEKPRPKRYSASGSNAPYAPKGTANRRKTEAVDLQKQVDTLQQIVDTERAKLPPRVASTEEQLTLSREWETMAQRQRTQRLGAETENAALRKALKSQLQSARRIKALTRRVDAIRFVLGTEETVDVDKYNGPRVAVDEHLQHLRSLQTDADTVLSASPFTVGAAPRAFTDVGVTQAPNGGVEIGFAMQWTPPFAVEAVADVLWAMMTRMHRHERVIDFKDLYATSDVLVSQFVSKPKYTDTLQAATEQLTKGSTCGQSAARRLVVEPSGSVLLLSDVRAYIFESSGECKGDMRGDGWILIEPLPSTEPYCLCQVKWHRRILGSLPESAVATQPERAKWVHHIVSGPMRAHWKTTIDTNRQAIENSLLAMAQARRE